MYPEEGTLIKMERTGRFATVVRGVYTHRFMNSEQDRIMAEHGMGHLAGTYGSAIDVIYMDNGQRRRLELKHPISFKVISSPEETAEA